jgi:hypothetical protein
VLVGEDFVLISSSAVETVRARRHPHSCMNTLETSLIERSASPPGGRRATPTANPER